jgi:hypothetical protein
MMVTLDGSDASSRDQRTRSSPTLATDSLVPHTAKPLRVSRIDWAAMLEPGASDPPTPAPTGQRVEPVAVGPPRVPAGLHQRDGGDLGQPRPLRRALGEGDHTTLQFGVAELLPGQVGAAPFGEGVVVDHPGAPERPRQRPPLPGGRVEAVAVPDQHAADPT